MSSQGWLLGIWFVSSSQVGSFILVPGPSWRDDITVAALLSLCMVAAPNRGLSRLVAAGVGFEHNTVWSARHGARHAQGACFLGCTCLCAAGGSPWSYVVWLALYVGLDPGPGLDFV
jgi:hypothetical protein